MCVRQGGREGEREEEGRYEGGKDEEKVDREEECKIKWIIIKHFSLFPLHLC
jgi:hypothetical protein